MCAPPPRQFATGPPIRGDPFSQSHAHIPLKPPPPCSRPLPRSNQLEGHALQHLGEGMLRAFPMGRTRRPFANACGPLSGKGSGDGEAAHQRARKNEVLGYALGDQGGEGRPVPSKLIQPCFLTPCDLAWTLNHPSLSLTSIACNAGGCRRQTTLSGTFGYGIVLDGSGVLRRGAKLQSWLRYP